MSTKVRKGLGQGLGALLPSSKISINKITSIDNNEMASSENTVKQISLSKIQAGKYQPRHQFDETNLTELAQSIKENGVIQPIILREIADGKYEIIAGERRFRATKIAGLSKIPAIVRDYTEQEALVVALIENIQRKDLNVIEEALGYKQLISEFGLKHDEISKITGKSRSAISNTLRLLNLPVEITDLLIVGDVDMGHARALLPLDKTTQLQVASQIVEKKLTTAAVEKIVANLLSKDKDESELNVELKTKDADIKYLEDKLANSLAMNVEIKHNMSKGKGKIVLSYASIDELDGFLAKLEK